MLAIFFFTHYQYKLHMFRLNETCDFMLIMPLDTTIMNAFELDFIKKKKKNSF